MSETQIPPEHSPVTTTQGRSDSPNVNLNGSSQVSAVHYSRQGGVVIRATVEHIGLVGDTEMTVNVKWPASSFCAPQCAQSPAPGGQVPMRNHAPANGPEAHNWNPGVLFGIADTGPEPQGGAPNVESQPPSTGEADKSQGSDGSEHANPVK